MEVYADGRVRILVEFSFDELTEERALSHRTISDHDDSQLVEVVRVECLRETHCGGGVFFVCLFSSSIEESHFYLVFKF